jgi:hypothetical protein
MLRELVLLGALRVGRHRVGVVRGAGMYTLADLLWAVAGGVNRLSLFAAALCASGLESVVGVVTCRAVAVLGTALCAAELVVVVRYRGLVGRSWELVLVVGRDSGVVAVVGCPLWGFLVVCD